MKLGYCLTGSFCTFARSIAALERLVALGYDVQPIMSENAYATDTRFGAAALHREKIEAICGRKIIHTVKDAEPLGPADPLDLLIIAPCTGNTLAKLARGITDTAATMAAKAHLRRDRPLVIALSSNDAMSQNLGSIAALICRQAVTFVPMKQDDPTAKPHSLVADFNLIEECVECALRSEQKRPLFL
ncbi:MAG: dipicolinate synthase subunit B [Clostridia bacterium]|nr:dipicolinate synthase subunit B [Clostridia bacterium]